MSILVPAVLPATKSELFEEIALFARMKNVSRIQIDSVDGRFASPACWPYTATAEFRALRAAGAMLPLRERFEYEVDLMCLDAERAGSAWLALGASRLVFHAESTTDLPRLLMRMHALYGSSAGFVPELLSFGIAINLATELALIEPALAYADFVQFMGIARIGRQHQPFDDRVFDKIRAFRKRHPDMQMQVDGGVTLAHAHELVVLGIEHVVVGSAVLRADDPVAAAAAFDALESPYGV